MFAHQKKRLEVLFAGTDGLLAALAFECAYWTRLEASLDQVFYLTSHIHFLLVFFSAATIAALGLQDRVYRFSIPTSLPFVLRRTFRQVVLGMGLLVMAQYGAHLPVPLSRSFLALFGIFGFVLLVVSRLLAPRWISRLQQEFGQPYHVVLVGDGERLEHLRHEVCDRTPFRIEIVAKLKFEACTDSLGLLLRERVVDEVIFGVPAEQLGALQPALLLCDAEGVQTRVAMLCFPLLNSALSLDKVGSTPLLTFSAVPADELRLMVKRLIDFSVAAFALLLFAPIMVVVAMAIKATSAGPVFFRQVRCGLNGRRFTMYKFRSMVDNADLLKQNFQHLSEREVAFKVRSDPRTTRIGRFLRRYSIDEWPQFYNVLRGDMALVGPRPPLPEEVEQYESWQKRRLRMRPGLTCLWAIMGRDHLDFQSWMRTDMLYIDHWSLWLDWSILLRTVPQVLIGKGAH